MVRTKGRRQSTNVVDRRRETAAAYEQHKYWQELVQMSKGMRTATPTGSGAAWRRRYPSWKLPKAGK